MADTENTEIVNEEVEQSVEGGAPEEQVREQTEGSQSQV